MTVLIARATGAIGRLIVEQIVDRGTRVRAVGRTPETATRPAE
ncbi:hypothetical protein [Nonomuraea sp. NPDC049784]